MEPFSAAHRLTHGYCGKCTNLHGHDYIPEITLKTEQLNKTGFVVEFADIKETCDKWIEENLDHVVVVSAKDQKLLSFLKQEQQNFYLLDKDENATVEIIAKHVFINIEKNILAKYPHVTLVNVRVWETPDSSAAYSND